MPFALQERLRATTPVYVCPAVLAACLHWLEAPQRRAQDVAEIFSKIRFPAIPASVLVDLHGSRGSLQRFDPDKELLLRAVRHGKGFLARTHFPFAVLYTTAFPPLQS